MDVIVGNQAPARNTTECSRGRTRSFILPQDIYIADAMSSNWDEIKQLEISLVANMLPPIE